MNDEWPTHVRVRVAADLSEAVAFYRAALDSAWDLPITTDSAVLGICDGRVLVFVLPEHAQPPDYGGRDAKGRTPRLELRTPDVEEAVARFVAAGGRVRVDLNDRPPRYVQALDPFGHMWSFAEDRSDAHLQVAWAAEPPPERTCYIQRRCSGLTDILKCEVSQSGSTFEVVYERLEAPLTGEAAEAAIISAVLRGRGSPRYVEPIDTVAFIDAGDPQRRRKLVPFAR